MTRHPGFGIPPHGRYRMHVVKPERRDYGPPTLRGMVRAAFTREAVVFAGIVVVVLAAGIIGVRV